MVLVMHPWGTRLVLLAAIVAGVLATPIAGPGEDAPGPTAAAASAASVDPRPVEQVALRAESPGLQARDLALTPARLRSTLEVRPGVDLLALTWRGATPAVQVRTRTAGRWGTWQSPELLPDAPDRASGEGSRSGTDQVWTPGADAVQVRAAGGVPRSLRLSLVAVEETPADLRAARLGRTAAGQDVAAAAARNKFRPVMRGRRAWGADERLRSGRPTYNRTVQQVHVHHTVNSNDYRPGEVPGLIRGMYRYHTVSLGWSDLGYNAVVDRFGRTWVGRAGGITRRVRGAHTLGFNSTSTGVAVLGNFETARPSSKVVTALVRYAAWKLHKDGRNPRGRVTVFSHGSDRFRYGAKPRLPTIDGHRDTSETACPGEFLYRKLPVIRQRAAARIARMR